MKLWVDPRRIGGDIAGWAVMVERIVKVVCFVLAAAFFAIVGGIVLAFVTYDLPPGAKATKVGQLKAMGPRVEEFRRVRGRLPTDSEIACDLKPCTRSGFVVWRVTPEEDGHFRLTYTSLGVMFTPAHTFDTTWHSRTGKTDREGWGQLWQYARYYGLVLLSVAIILLPWIWAGAGYVARRRHKSLVPSHTAH
ncbi:MAG: hypothetical protein EXR12_05135 [Rhodospirillaceae bacterium]|nr:hypothetical protein [Rhodospirillaceae bacterium]